MPMQGQHYILPGQQTIINDEFEGSCLKPAYKQHGTLLGQRTKVINEFGGSCLMPRQGQHDKILGQLTTMNENDKGSVGYTKMQRALDEIRGGICVVNAKVKFSDRISKFRSQINKWLVGSPEGVEVAQGAGAEVAQGAGGKATQGAEGVEMTHHVPENTEVVHGALETNSGSGLRIPPSSDSQGRVLPLIPPRVNGYPAHNTRFRKNNTRFRTNKFSFRCASFHNAYNLNIKLIKFIVTTTFALRVVHCFDWVLQHRSHYGNGAFMAIVARQGPIQIMHEKRETKRETINLRFIVSRQYISPFYRFVSRFSFLAFVLLLYKSFLSSNEKR